MKRHGVHTLEYAVLISAVVAAYLSLHTYVQRSINANLKALEGEINTSIQQIFPVATRVPIVPPPPPGGDPSDPDPADPPTDPSDPGDPGNPTTPPKPRRPKPPGGRGGPRCVVAGTMLDVEGHSPLAVETVRVQARVLGYDFAAQQARYATVTFAEGFERTEAMIMETVRGTVTASDGHRFWTGQDWTPNHALRVGDVIYRLEGGQLVPETITAIRTQRGRFTVYDITVPATANFFANGFLVHNYKSADAASVASVGAVVTDTSAETDDADETLDEDSLDAAAGIDESDEALE